MAFNENSRVKIPAVLHLMKLGYQYISLSQQNRRADTNIFEDIFVESLLRINPHVTKKEIIRVLDELSLELDYEDLYAMTRMSSISNNLSIPLAGFAPGVR